MMLTRSIRLAAGMAALSGLLVAVLFGVLAHRSTAEAEVAALFDEMSGLTARLYGEEDPGDRARRQREAEATFARLLAHCQDPAKVAICREVSRDHEGRPGPSVVPLGQGVPHSFEDLGTARD